MLAPRAEREAGHPKRHIVIIGTPAQERACSALHGSEGSQAPGARRSSALIASHDQQRRRALACDTFVARAKGTRLEAEAFGDAEHDEVIVPPRLGDDDLNRVVACDRAQVR